MARQPSILPVIIISILFVALGVALLMYFDVHEDVLQLLDWLDALGIWGPLLFIMIMVLVVVLVLPGVMFTAGAGF
ncbi:MAG: TVP38/TMEM64 family protein, partial [Gammaproteobacteria bacterium]|nr:TVP38/TMEM64 family protein [Gammaproteobacteria bacterium]